ncbi:MAG: GTP cyclohydrolase IIa [Halobacteriaceae archaeon]
MTNTQVTLVQIDNYGPWTVTPAPRREPDLQALQADLYADLARQFGSRDGYVFYTRFDNVLAVTNGIDRAAHARVQEAVRNRYPVTVSLSTARAETPAAAEAEATARLQAAGGAQEADRREALRGDPTARTESGDVEVAHFDVVDVTDTYTDAESAFDSLRTVERAYLELADRLHDGHDSLAFFVGGDNVIAVTPGLSRGAYESVVDGVRAAAGVDLRVGVGDGATAAEAGMSAKHALEECRERDLTVSGDLRAIRGN